MSSSLTHLLPPSPGSSQPASKSHRLLTPTTNPIYLVSSPWATRYSYIHTVLVPLYYYIRASALVAVPFPTLLTDLGVVAALQCVFCAVCLPQAGAWLSGTSGGPILEGSASAGSSPTAGRGAKSSKGSATGTATGTGSLRKRNLGTGAKSAAKSGHGATMGGEGGWKSRIMVSLLPMRSRPGSLSFASEAGGWFTFDFCTQSNREYIILTKGLPTANVILPHPNANTTALTSNPHSPCAGRASLPDLPSPADPPPVTPRLAPRLPPAILHPRRVCPGLARHCSSMAALRWSRRVGFLGGCISRRLGWCNSHGIGLGP